MATAKKAGAVTVEVSVKTLRAAVAALAGLVECRGEPRPEHYAEGRATLAALRKVKGVKDGNA